MIVGNNPKILKNVQCCLEHEPIRLITMPDNRQALEHLNNQEETTFDLILINTTMPGKKNISAFFSMNPHEKKQDNSQLDNFLPIPFTKNEFREFLKHKLK